MPRGRPKRITEVVPVALPEESKQEPIQKYDLSSTPFALILYVGDESELTDEFKANGVQYINIREYFYTKYLPNKMLIPKYPFKITDGWVQKLVTTCAEILPMGYRFNRSRVAVSRYSGLILQEQGDFFALVDRFLKDYMPEFFIYSLKFPESGTWIIGGINHKSEQDYLRIKFKSVKSISIDKNAPDWVDIKLKNKTKFPQMMEVICN